MRLQHLHEIDAELRIGVGVAASGPEVKDVTFARDSGNRKPQQNRAAFIGTGRLSVREAKRERLLGV
jgi:hypothetical protein